ncbi:MAG: transcriptional regulator PpsR [Gemmatimonadetes bacterium]|nr:transcriptional regulator PpsR [Gemmatimonadota bacterium]
MKTFDARLGALGDLDPSLLGPLVSAVSDVALLIDPQGVVADVLVSGDDLPADDVRGWLGRSWADSATTESREKIADMLDEARARGLSSRRQVNHPSPHGPDLPVSYVVLSLGGDGHLVALGRDLHVQSVLQQRLAEAQQAMERDYWRMRHIETRYRLLFQLSSEAVLVVDAGTLKIVDANSAVGRLFGVPAKRLVGRVFPIDFDEESDVAVREVLAAVRNSGRSEERRLRTITGTAVAFGASLVRQDGTSLFLIRMMPIAEGTQVTTVSEEGRLESVVEAAPDGIVVTDLEGRVLVANRGFLDLAQLAAEDQVRGQPLERWVGRPGADVGVLLSTLREHGVARLFATGVRGEYCSTAEVELSAAVTRTGREPVVGIIMRDIGRRLANRSGGARDLGRAVKQLTSLVGRVSLPDLVRDTTDLVERHFIEAALELTEQNRTSAAEVLGVSRQSLYVKLRRYNVGRDDAPRSGSEPSS